MGLIHCLWYSKVREFPQHNDNFCEHVYGIFRLLKIDREVIKVL